MNGTSGVNGASINLLLAGLRLYVGEEDYKKLEMFGRMAFEEDYLMKCDYHFTGKRETIDCVIEDNYGTTSKFSRKTDSAASARAGKNESTNVFYVLGNFTMKIRTYSKPHKGVYFKIDVFTKEGPALKRNQG
jgi:hypothetical protein